MALLLNHAPPELPRLIEGPLTTDVKVRVTREDMRRGRAWSATDCPMARALQRAFPGILVTVYGADFALGYTPQDLPWYAVLFTAMYDLTCGAAGWVWPAFTFTVRR